MCLRGNFPTLDLYTFAIMIYNFALILDKAYWLKSLEFVQFTVHCHFHYYWSNMEDIVSEVGKGCLIPLHIGLKTLL